MKWMQSKWLWVTVVVVAIIAAAGYMLWPRSAKPKLEGQAWTVTATATGSDFTAKNEAVYFADGRVYPIKHNIVQLDSGQAVTYQGKNQFVVAGATGTVSQHSKQAVNGTITAGGSSGQFTLTARKGVIVPKKKAMTAATIKRQFNIVAVHYNDGTTLRIAPAADTDGSINYTKHNGQFRLGQFKYKSNHVWTTYSDKQAVVKPTKTLNLDVTAAALETLVTAPVKTKLFEEELNDIATVGSEATAAYLKQTLASKVTQAYQLHDADKNANINQSPKIYYNRQYIMDSIQLPEFNRRMITDKQYQAIVKDPIRIVRVLVVEYRGGHFDDGADARGQITYDPFTGKALLEGDREVTIN